MKRKNERYLWILGAIIGSFILLLPIEMFNNSMSKIGATLLIIGSSLRIGELK